MTFLLDTNVGVHVIRKKGNLLVKQRVAARPNIEMVLCSIVEAELLAGAEGGTNPMSAVPITEAFVAKFVSLPFNSMSAKHYAAIRAHLERLGTPIGNNDMMIAAIALQHDLTVVTHNTSEFSRVPGLKIVDWEVP